jgi:hypothetical protein
MGEVGSWFWSWVTSNWRNSFLLTSDDDFELDAADEDVVDESPPVSLLVVVSMLVPSALTFAVTTWGVAVLEESSELTLADTDI